MSLEVEHPIGSIEVLHSDIGKDYECQVMDHYVWSVQYQNETKIIDWTPEYDEAAMQWFRDKILFRVSKKHAPYILVVGDERVGKSTWAMKFCRMLDPTFDIDRVCFRIKDFNQQINKCEKGQVIDFDEAGFELSSYKWQKLFQINLYLKSQVIGKKQEVCVLTLPHITDLMLGFRMRRVDYLVYCYGKNENTERGFVEIRKAEKDRWFKRIYWAPLVAFRFAEDTSDFWRNEYEPKKDAFIDEVTSEEVDEDSQPASARVRDLMSQRNALIYFILDELPKKLKKTRVATELQLGKFLGLSQVAISDALIDYKTSLTKKAERKKGEEDEPEYISTNPREYVDEDEVEHGEPGSKGA